ncbi:hypothetical protein N9790_03550 [Gammaproteobacteria bacterium]|nr:hypothetical protein [Gammaproteobacteria bacterium]
MKDKTLKILLGIIALNLTVQTLKDVEIFPTAHAQSRPMQVVICDLSGIRCADTKRVGGGLDGIVIAQ